MKTIHGSMLYACENAGQGVGEAYGSIMGPSELHVGIQRRESHANAFSVIFNAWN